MLAQYLNAIYLAIERFKERSAMFSYCVERELDISCCDRRTVVKSCLRTHVENNPAFVLRVFH